MNNPTPLLDAARGACIALPQHHHGEKHRQPNQHCTAPHEPLTYRPTLEERSFLRSLRATTHRKGKGTYKLEPYEAGCMLIDGPSQEDVDATQQGLNKSISTLQNGNWHMVILDEITIALHLGLITKK